MSARTCDTSRPAPDLNISCHECFRGTGGDGATARSIQGRGEAPAGGGGGRGCVLETPETPTKVSELV